MLKGKKIQRNQRLPFICFLVLTAGLIACCIAYFAASSHMVSQGTAERFKGEKGQGEYSQTAAYFPAGKGLDIQGMYAFRTALEAKLVEVSLEKPEVGSLWKDAYSGASTLTVKSGKASAETKVLGVGGDFFLFHPLELLSGRYIYEDDLMHDGVILDEVLAWQLFGGTELEGMTVAINDKPYLVLGVVKLESDKVSVKAGSKGPCMYMYYDALNAIGEIKADCYELVCAEPITGFTKSVLTENFKAASVVQCSGRFTLKSTVRVLGSFNERAMVSTGVSYPYWENAARLVENQKAVLLIACMLLGLFPLICLAWVCVYLYGRARRRMLEVLPPRWEAFKDNVRERQRLRMIRRAKEKEEDFHDQSKE